MRTILHGPRTIEIVLGESTLEVYPDKEDILVVLDEDNTLLNIDAPKMWEAWEVSVPHAAVTKIQFSLDQSLAIIRNPDKKVEVRLCLDTTVVTLWKGTHR